VAVEGVVEVGDGEAVGAGVSVGRGVRDDVGVGGMNPVGVLVGVGVIVGSTDGRTVAGARVAVAVGEMVGVGVAPFGAFRMAISPAQ
jgi:hypothetical protein